MATIAGPGYDLETLLRARGDSPLEVRQGLAATFQWVARAEEGLEAAVTAEGQATRTLTDLMNVPGPGHRAAMRALLEDARQALAGPGGLGAPALIPSPRHGTATTLGLRVVSGRSALRIARAHAALVREGDQLLAVRRRPSAYVLVVREGMVVAAIRATPAPGVETGELRLRLPVVPRRP